jgi:hypothetical protein
MDYKDLTAILLKVTGVALIFLFLNRLSFTLGLLAKDSYNIQILLLETLPNAFGILLGCILFFFPATISNKLISGEKLNHDATFVNSLQIAALKLLGIYQILMAIIDLVHHFSKAMIIHNMLEKTGAFAISAWTPDLIAWVIATIVQLLIALWFTFGAEGILGFIQKIRGHKDF